MTERGRFIRRVSLVYGCAYLLGSIAMHLIKLHTQGKPLTTDLAAFLAGDILAAAISSPILGWLAWRQHQRKLSRTAIPQR